MRLRGVAAFIGTYPATILQILLVIASVGIGGAMMQTATFRNLLDRMQIPRPYHMRVVDVLPYMVCSVYKYMCRYADIDICIRREGPV